MSQVKSSSTLTSPPDNPDDGDVVDEGKIQASVGNTKLKQMLAGLKSKTE